jgi:CDP-diacylglycerol--glycerol-3-phosphate 3-phosphatidyltransferase
MLNFLRPFFARLFSPLIQALARTPVTPNMITVAGTVGVSAACLGLFPIGETFPGAATATVFVFTDMLDGQLARIKGSSGKFGAFLDSTMDRVADASVYGGITIWFMRSDHLLAVVSLFCLASGLCVSYVKARAEGLGLNADVGLIERPERLLIGLTGIGLSGLGVPYVMAIAMWAVAAGSAYTLYQRIYAVHKDAKAQAAQSTQAQSTQAQPAQPQAAAEPSTAAEAAAEQPAPAQPAAEPSTAAQAAAGEQIPAAESAAAHFTQAELSQAQPTQAQPASAQSEEA